MISAVPIQKMQSAPPTDTICTRSLSLYSMWYSNPGQGNRGFNQDNGETDSWPEEDQQGDAMKTSQVALEMQDPAAEEDAAQLAVTETRRPGQKNFSEEEEKILEVVTVLVLLRGCCKLMLLSTFVYFTPVLCMFHFLLCQPGVMSARFYKTVR